MSATSGNTAGPAECPAASASRLGRRRMGRALVCFLVLAAALPAAAHARPVDVGLSMKFFGSHPFHDQSLNPIAPSIRSFVTAVRWHSVQRSCKAIRRGRYDWTRLDNAMETIDALGLRLNAVLKKGPRCATVGRSTDGRPKRRYVGEWSTFARKLARRYGPHGSQAAHPMRAIEVWGEPNLNSSWGASATHYARTFIRVARAVANGDRDVRMVVGGLALSTVDWPHYLDRLFDHGAFRRQVDAVGAHTYSPRPGVAIRRLEVMHRVIRRNRSRAPIAVTEHGWSTCPRPGRDTSSQDKCVRRSRQARYLGGYVRKLRDARGIDVSSFHWFTTQDFATRRSAKRCKGNPKDFYGLYDFKGRAKPSQDVWERLTATNVAETIPPNPRIRQCRGRQA